MRARNSLLLFAALVLIIAPLLMGFEGEDIFSGADGQAQDRISQIRPGYEPWAAPMWEPPSGEIESLLFALQAAIGAGVLGYYLGVRRGERRGSRPAA